MQRTRPVRSNLIVHSLNPTDVSVRCSAGGDYYIYLEAPTAVLIKAHNVKCRSVQLEDEDGNDMHKWFFTLKAVAPQDNGAADVVAVPAAAVPPRLDE